MGYRLVDGEGLDTRYADRPDVSIHALDDGPLSLELIFQCEPAAGHNGARFTRVRFGDVREYRWIASDQTYFLSNPDDFEFSLIELVDSDQIRRLLAHGIYADRPYGQRLGGTTPETALRHFRLGFDEYGCFDVICLEVSTHAFYAKP